MDVTCGSRGGRGMGVEEDEEEDSGSGVDGD